MGRLVLLHLQQALQEQEQQQVWVAVVCRYGHLKLGKVHGRLVQQAQQA
jgi:hypothetical protein